MTRRFRIAMVVAGLLPTTAARADLLDGLAALGDSLTDEYRADDDRAALNWLEQLVLSRGMNFGAWSTASRGEPRRAGYEYNWARSGATAAGTRSFDLRLQHPGVVPQVARADVTLVYLGIGANDFGPSDFGLYLDIHDGTLSGDALTMFIDTVVGRIETAVDAVLAAGDVRMVLGNIVDYAVTPSVRSRTSEVGRARVTQAVMQANIQIQALGDQRGIPVLDLFEIGNLSLRESLTVGGVAIDPRGANDAPHAFFVGDQIHPGTLAQGLIANLFIQAINAAYDAGVTPLTEQEILINAGIEPPGDFDQDGDVDLPDFLAFSQCFSGTGIPACSSECASECCRRIESRRGGSCRSPADLDGDGDVDMDDLIQLQMLFTGSR